MRDTPLLEAPGSDRAGPAVEACADYDILGFAPVLPANGDLILSARARTPGRPLVDIMIRNDEVGVFTTLMGFVGQQSMTFRTRGPRTTHYRADGPIEAGLIAAGETDALPPRLGSALRAVPMVIARSFAKAEATAVTCPGAGA